MMDAEYPHCVGYHRQASDVANWLRPGLDDDAYEGQNVCDDINVNDADYDYDGNQDKDNGDRRRGR